MKEIKLLHGEIALVDNEDYDVVMKYRWRTTKNKRGTTYATTTIWVKEKKSQTQLSMHKKIMGTPPRKGLMVDHKNRKTLDNRRCNLRWVTPTQNSFNSEKRTTNRHSKYKGVTFYPKRNKWKSSIMAYGKATFVGHFDSEIEAALAWNEKAKELHGEFAVLNIIHPQPYHP